MMSMIAEGTDVRILSDEDMNDASGGCLALYALAGAAVAGAAFAAGYYGAQAISDAISDRGSKQD